MQGAPSSSLRAQGPGSCHGGPRELAWTDQFCGSTAQSAACAAAHSCRWDAGPAHWLRWCRTCSHTSHPPDVLQQPHAPPLCKQLQLALLRSEELLDLVAAGDIQSYDEVRPALAAAYKEGGLPDTANFITATS